MKTTLIIITTICAITAFALYAMWSSESYSNNAKTVTVICGVGFFYDLREKNESLVIVAESLASICKRNPIRNQTDAFNSDNSPKRVVQIPSSNTCVINWELTPQTHREAYVKECLRIYPKND